MHSSFLCWLQAIRASTAALQRPFAASGAKLDSRCKAKLRLYSEVVQHTQEVNVLAQLPQLPASRGGIRSRVQRRLSVIAPPVPSCRMQQEHAVAGMLSFVHDCQKHDQLCSRGRTNCGMTPSLSSPECEANERQPLGRLPRKKVPRRNVCQTKNSSRTTHLHADRSSSARFPLTRETGAKRGFLESAARACQCSDGNTGTSLSH